MPLPRIVAAGCCVALALASLGNAPSPTPRIVAQGIPVGRWIIHFDNGVIEGCTVGRDGKAKVVEPLRISDGKVSVAGKAFLIACDDDRTERWTPAGDQMIVEHWCPGSAWRTGTPVWGIARRVP